MSEPDADPVLAVLLARHRAVLTSERPALLRTDQLMAAEGDPARVPTALRRWLADPWPARAGVHRWPLRPGTGADVTALLADLPDREGRPVHPIHLLRAAPRWRGGPAGPPTITHAGPPPPPAPEPGARPMTVVVLDTGITGHPWFSGRAWFGGLTSDQMEILDANHDHRLDSVAGHGTFVAGVLEQHAPSATLRIERVLGSDGVCDEVDLIETLHRLGADPNRSVDVVNMSFGGFTHDDRASSAVAGAVAALGPRTVLVAAAGNDGVDRPFWPAALDGVIAVGALDAGGRERAAFSNHGGWVDTWAPGEDVWGAFVAPGRELPRHPSDDRTYYARWSGTSFAAPAVSGAIARRAAQLGCTAGRAAAELLGAADSGRGNFPRALPDPGSTLTP